VQHELFSVFDCFVGNAVSATSIGDVRSAPLMVPLGFQPRYLSKRMLGLFWASLRLPGLYGFGFY
jgi:hypothetical protein